MARRERGKLEAEILQFLWRAPDGMTSSALEAAFDAAHRPARTTLLTVLARLEDKELVERIPSQRGAVFRAVTDEADHVAGSMSALLQRATDREAALSQFVGRLDRSDREALRDLFGVE